MSKRDSDEKSEFLDGGREERGRFLARRLGHRIQQLGDRWIVPSTNPASAATYLVDLVSETCTCDDFMLRRAKCKHLHAVEFSIAWQGHGDRGSAMEPPKKPHWPQNSTARNLALVNEQEHVELLLHALCDSVSFPERTNRMGRRPLPPKDLLFAALLKIYTTMSGRRAQGALRGCRARGHVGIAASYNSVLAVFGRSWLTPILEDLIGVTAAPFASLERSFAQDATGFSQTRRDNYFASSHDDQRAQRPFVKLHAMVGVRTNVVTAARVSNRGDAPMLEPLLVETMRRGFVVEEVSADKAYLSYANIDAIRAAGAMPFIPLKSNSTTKASHSKAWRDLHAFFLLRHDEFLKRYHQRSNVETTFGMIKKRFGDGVRTLLPVTQANEVLAKVVLHNICCAVAAFYESGLEPDFWSDLPSTPMAPAATRLRSVKL